MTFVRVGNMWNSGETPHRQCITTNAIVKANGELVMGRGAAEMAARKYPGLAERLGASVTSFKEIHGDVPYGLLFDTETNIVAFQVKDHWGQQAKKELIEYSTSMLDTYAREHNEERIYLNFPGIGYGRLQVEDIVDILSCLPDNVVVWTYYRLPKEQQTKLLRR